RRQISVWCNAEQRAITIGSAIRGGAVVIAVGSESNAIIRRGAVKSAEIEQRGQRWSRSGDDGHIIKHEMGAQSAVTLVWRTAGRTEGDAGHADIVEIYVRGVGCAEGVDIIVDQIGAVIAFGFEAKIVVPACRDVGREEGKRKRTVDVSEGAVPVVSDVI